MDITATEAIPATAHLHAADTPELVRAPAATFVSTTGNGRPGTDSFYRKKALVAAIAAALPRSNGAVDVVEILYHYPTDAAPVEIADFYSVNPIDMLEYRVLAQVGDDTTAEDLASARRAAPSADDDLTLFTLPERLVVQVTHHGPFAEEFGTLARLGAFASARHLRRVGAHHEIHLDPFTATTPQEHLRTILRDPVAP
ncbi:hypothetical protein [Actinophytocola glycyrrhizae]|uniref:GyrI-like small molecule binding domain-containing protein n=1 Tax=Actinophytocola glycyrrhizae TaxID=2044873 RepID=A0ABV9SCC7_9PSEU